MKYLNRLFLKKFSVLHFIWTFLEQKFPLLLQLDSVSFFFFLFVCGLRLPKLRHPAENQSLPSHYVLGLLAANVKLLPVLSDQSVAAEQMARLSAEVSAQQSRFVTLSKASPSCRAAKNGSTCPALRHPHEAVFFFLIFVTKERPHSIKPPVLAQS